jgi:hypothetical protein
MQQPQHYREKVTGARPDRRELLRMLDRIGPRDAVTVTRIDRLARSTFDLFASHRRRRRRPSGGVRRALRSKNWRTATTSAARRFHGSELACP